jgi:hypothetical protein
MIRLIDLMVEKKLVHGAYYIRQSHKEYMELG